MIVTVTPNPSIDRTLIVDAFQHGELNRAVKTKVDPGGKGINVSMALALNQRSTTAVFPSGGHGGQELEYLLKQANIATSAVPIMAGVRSNISLVEPDGVTTKINEPGPPLTPTEVAELLHTVRQRSTGASWLAGCGSLPPGAPTMFYADLVETVGMPVAVDTSGPALIAAVEAGAALVKPNTAELAEATGSELATLGDIADAAHSLIERGATQVLVSMGEDGAMLTDGTSTIIGTAPVADFVSAVGAGDALLAGFLAGGGSGQVALATGLAWAAAACSLANTQMPSPSSISAQRPTIKSSFDPSHPLSSAEAT